MNRFPLCINLEDKNFLVVGSGMIARRKLSAISEFTSNITVISKEGAEGLAREGIKVVNKCFDDKDLEGFDFVITATGSREQDEAIVAACKSRGIPVNAADDREECDFFLPGIIKRGDLVVSVSTSGKSPAYSKHLREQIEEIIPDNIEKVLDIMGELRKSLPSKVESQKERSLVYNYVMHVLLSMDDLDEANVDKIIEEYCDAKNSFSDKRK
ncbi:MAG: bifunctional precorrin-2 dehydrogenase/sirohydrochlorin ferrochelatase [[Eubacterium] sulci]|jgi:siroheme synthase, N-terminal domain|nr:bifunctional precorrin-2 dehydrogenase/sirohydrochlorin ferrochelatase [[Eubacterium] sulci]MBF1183289.1 bifunctional precorrin-2 dehydrogenase/sirohydrochlorin ferrochelatase [[Eubacterium] sulci]